MNRILKLIADIIIYGFFSLFTLVPLICVIYEIVHLKFEMTPFILIFALIFGLLYYIGLRSSCNAVRRNEELAQRFGFQFTYSKGYVPGIIYWPKFTGVYLRKSFYIWFRGRMTTAIEVSLSEYYKNISLDLKHKEAPNIFNEPSVREKVAAFVKTSYGCMISGQRLIVIIRGMPGSVDGNEGIAQTIDELVALTAIIDP